MTDLLNRHFGLAANGTTVKTEVIAGVTTFLTMAYIIFVNPSILSNTGMDRDAVFVATCIAAAVGTLIMGLYANYPIALAPGMGLNAYFAFGVVLGMEVSWQVALGAVFVSGLIFLVISVLPIRAAIINAIPASQKQAISAGIGLFLAIIALQAAGVVVDHPATLVTQGDMTAWPAILALVGFIGVAVLTHYRIAGAIIIIVLALTVVGAALGLTEVGGVVSLPPDPTPTLLQLDIAGALSLGLVTVVFAFLFVDLFDTAGTLVGVAARAGLLDSQGRLPRVGQALVADSTATMAGALLGTSTTTSYIESAAGIKEGGRTGLTAVVVAILFLAALFLSPLAAAVPAFATAPALLFVACLMARGFLELDWDDVTEFAPAMITAITIPLTFSIAAGIGFGFIAFVAIKALSGKPKQVHPIMWALAGLFVLKFALL